MPAPACPRSASCLATVALALAAIPASAHAIVVGTLHDFEDGTIQNWIGGTDRTNQPGGPAGPSDRFLRIQSTGGGGAGSHLAAHQHEPEWIGDYQAAGVTAIEADVRNFGATQITLRIMFFSLGTRWTSNTSIVLPAGGGWTHAVFPISQAGFTRALGTNSYESMITAVDGLMIKHDVSASAQGDPIVAVLGVDNIRAVPAPGASALLAVGGLALARRRR